MFPMALLLDGTGEAASALYSAVSSANIGGVLDEVIGLLPTVLPVMIGFLAIRKGIAFVLGMLRSA